MTENKDALDVEREVHGVLFDVMDLTVGQEKELREKFITLCARVEADAVRREWLEVERLKDEIRCCGNHVSEQPSKSDQIRELRKLQSYVRHRDACSWKNEKKCFCGLKQVLVRLAAYTASPNEGRGTNGQQTEG